MKITPLEIRQKAFEKTFRGYDKDEVEAFLQILSAEWEKSTDERKELAIKLEAAEKEITKLREVENSLYKTLKTAEDTGANMIEQANKASKLQLKEAGIKADNLVREAKAKATMIEENAEKRAKDIISKMLNEIQSLEYNFNAAITLKENLLADLTNLSSATLERAQKFKKQKDKLDIEKYIKEARDFAENYDLKNVKFGDPEAGDSQEQDESQINILFERKNSGGDDKPEPKKKVDIIEENNDADKSFFDLLE